MSSSSSSVVVDRSKLADGDIVDDVKTLLSSVNFLCSGKGHEVPIHYLEGKVVGLYFYSCVSDSRDLDKLDYMYKESKIKDENFELVFICLRMTHLPEKFEEDTFYSHFRDKTWLASDFSNWEKNEKLFAKFCLLCDPWDGPNLVIIRPEDNVAHTHAWNIFQEYGIQAYPFSKSRVTEIEVARLKTLTLDCVCSTKDYLISWGDNGEEKKVPLHVSGKNTIFFMTTEPDDFSIDGYRDKRIHEKVFQWYLEMKQKVPHFEMVRVVYNCNVSLREDAKSCNWEMPSLEVRRDECHHMKAVMPWLEFPCDKHEMQEVYQIFFKIARHSCYDFLPVFVAFGQDGKFKSMTSLGRFLEDEKIDPCMTFFDDGHLYREVRDYIAMCKGWSTVNEETGECYIPL